MDSPFKETHRNTFSYLVLSFSQRLKFSSEWLSYLFICRISFIPHFFVWDPSWSSSCCLWKTNCGDFTRGGGLKKHPCPLAWCQSGLSEFNSVQQSKQRGVCDIDINGFTGILKTNMVSEMLMVEFKDHLRSGASSSTPVPLKRLICHLP